MVDIDIHVHTMDIDDTAEYQFGKVSKWIGKKDWRLKFVSKLLYAIPLIEQEELDRLALLLDKMDDSTESKIKSMLKRVDCIVINTMDLAFCGCGKVKRKFETQLNILITLKQHYNIKIFMMLDPKRPNLNELVEQYHMLVDGWKLYPALGYYPNDPILVNIFKKYPKPITSHCTDTSPIYYKGDDVDMLIKWSHFTSRHGKQKEKCQSFTHPYWLGQLAKEVDCNINAAHAGGSNIKWVEYIKRYCKELPNFYTDCSYTFADKDFSITNLMKGIESKVLYGTDEIMIEPFLVDHMTQLQQNNERFLGLDMKKGYQTC